jgi:hypothetical protein
MRSRIKVGRRLMLLACLALCASSALQIAAQDANEELNGAARKFDEFGQVRGCDGGARLDNFAIQLQNEPTTIGYIVGYGPDGQGSGTGDAGLSIMTDYLVNSRGIGAERLRTIYAGRYKEWMEVATELWIAPRDAAPPEPLRYNTKPEPFTGKFEEFRSWASVGADDAGTGPTHGNVRRAAFADLLHQQTETRAVIVAYNMEGAVPGAWRRAAKEIADGLQHGYKIEAERIETIYAGYRKPEKKEEEEEYGEGADAFVQLWVLPKDAPPPVAAAKEAEQRPSQAVRIDFFSDYSLADDATVRSAFEGFADVLRNDEHLNACVIVRLKNKAAAENVEPGATTQPDTAPVETANQVEGPKVDLMALVEKWKADLVKDYGISEHRLVVITGEADQWSNGDVETWIVPRGAALPDPKASDVMTEDGEAITTGEEMMTEEDTQKEF